MQPRPDAGAIQSDNSIAMKILLALAVLASSFFLTGCHEVYIQRRHVVHDGYYGGRYDGGYYGSPVYRRPAVVIVNRPVYRPVPYYGGVTVVYAYDKHGRYYWHHGRKVYVGR